MAVVPLMATIRRKRYMNIASVVEARCGTRAVCAAALALLLLGGCAPSAEEIQEEFDAEVARSRACEQVSDCVVISPGCPLGCWVVVSAAAQDRVSRKARELIEDYESGGAACDYGCTEAPAVACLAGACSAAE
jgi:hypothetical protein